MLVRVLALAALVAGRTHSALERGTSSSCHRARPTGPGAGMKPEDLTMERTLKDGFYHVTCALDRMEEYADKFGDHRHSYEAGHPHTAFGNVSIVRYLDVVGREDRKLMTAQVCFDFCRTVPDMLFFGLLRGRECYCTPYFVEDNAAGSGACDFPCEGDYDKICGGLNRASLYEMHLCAETKKDIVAMVSAAEDLFNDAKPAAEAAVDLAAVLEHTANNLMTYSVGIGDMMSHANGQAAKVMAGKLKHAGEAAVTSAVELQKNFNSLKGMKDKDFGLVEHAYAAEDLLARTQKQMQVLQTTSTLAAEADAKVHPDLPSMVAGSDTSFLYFEGPKTYTEAIAACEAIGGNLTTINNRAQNQKVGTMLPIEAGSWAWVGNPTSDGEYENFLTGQPAGAGGCVRFFSKYNETGEVERDMWGDADCATKGAYVCSQSVTRVSADTSLAMFNSVLYSFDDLKASNVNTTLPTTCEGKYAGEPMTNLSLAECAEACTAHAPKNSVDYCVAFQFYDYAGQKSREGASLTHSLCYLYREVGKVDYFDCEVDRRPTTPALLQKPLLRRERSFLAQHSHEAGESSDFTRVGCYAREPVRCELERKSACWGLKAA